MGNTTSGAGSTQPYIEPPPPQQSTNVIPINRHDDRYQTSQQYDNEMAQQRPAHIIPPSPSMPSTDLTTALTTPASPHQPLYRQLMSNPVFAGGAGIAGLAAFAGIARQSLLTSLRLIQRHYTISLEINSKDRAYQWLLPYIHTRAGNAQHIAVETSVSTDSKSNSLTPVFRYVPAPGQHYFLYHRYLIQITRKREQSMLDLTTGLPYETVELKTVGRSRDVFTRLLTEARDIALQQQRGKTLIYTAMGLEWKQFGQPRDVRKLNSVVLDAGVSENIYNDLVEFSEARHWYSDRGIPYRRGYLLYGPPGCGKSSFISALAGELQYNICVLNLNERGLTDDRLAALMSVVPPRSFILLEDIDAALPATRPNAQANERQSYSVTFSGLLNILDGVTSGEERVVFMTTNYIDRLDSALIRPGRVDVQQYVGMATPHQLQVMFDRFYPGKQALCQQFVQALTTVNAQLSVAELQAYFLVHKDNAELATEQASVLAEQAVHRQTMLEQQVRNAVHDSSHTASVASASKL